MRTFQLRAEIPKNRRVEIVLPPEIPEGLADMVLIVHPATEEIPSEHTPQAKMATLERLRRLREQTAGRDIRLSDAIIEQRQAED